MKWKSTLLPAILVIPVYFIAAAGQLLNNDLLIWVIFPLALLILYFFGLPQILSQINSDIIKINNSEGNLMEVLENIPVPLAIIRSDGNVEFSNSEFSLLTGYQEHEISTINDWMQTVYKSNETRETAMASFEDSLIRLKTENRVDKEYSITSKNGNVLDFQFRLSSLKDKILIVLTDITHRNRLLDQLRLNERRINTMIQNLQGMIFQALPDNERTMNFVSEGCFRLTGYLPSDFTDLKRITILDLIPERFHEYIHNTQHNAIIQNEAFELQYQLICSSGELKWVSEKGIGLYNDDGGCYAIEGFIVDITDKVTILDSLRKSESRYRSLFENLPLALWEDDYSEVNQYLLSVEASGVKNLRKYFLDDTSRIQELISRVKIIDLNNASLKLYGGKNKEKLKKSVDTIFVRSQDEQFLNVILGMHEGKNLIESNSTEVEVNDEIRILKISWLLMPGHEDDFSRVLVTIVDITELRQAEKEILELNQKLEEKVQVRTDQLNRANKELEAFSYSVSHDLKAPLRAIRGFTGFLKTSLEDKLDDKSRHYLENVIVNADNMSMLINDLLQFSKLERKSIETKPVDLNLLVMSCWTDLTSLEKSPSISFKYSSLPEIRIDETLFRQVFLNLLSNAIKFSSTIKSPTISLTSRKIGSHYEFCLEDNGIGFDQKHEEKIFKVFQRLHTSEEYEGSGVGLALVQRIIHRHGGKIWVRSQEGIGTQFFFTIPVKIDSEL